METSEKSDALAGALAKAQGEFKPLEKNRTVTVRIKAEKGGGSYTFDYATLDECLRSTRPALAKHGLAVTQPAELNEHGAAVTTTLWHESGQWIRTRLTLRHEGSAQAVGTAITYARRYAYASLLGICAEEDDDGNEASGNQSERQPRQQQQQPAKASGAPKSAPPELTCSERAAKCKEVLLKCFAENNSTTAVKTLKAIPTVVGDGGMTPDDAEEIKEFITSQLVNRIRPAPNIKSMEGWKEFAIKCQPHLPPMCCTRIDEAWLARKGELLAETATVS